MTALRRRVVRHLVVCLATAVVVMVGIVAAGRTPHVEVIITLAVAVAVASVAVRQLGDSTEVLRWPRSAPDHRRRRGRRLAGRLPGALAAAQR